MITLRHDARLSSECSGRPDVPQGSAEDGGEVVAVGRFVAAGGEPLLLQGLQGSVGSHDGGTSQGASLLQLAVLGEVEQGQVAKGLLVDCHTLVSNLMPCKIVQSRML